MYTNKIIGSLTTSRSGLQSAILEIRKKKVTIPGEILIQELPYLHISKKKNERTAERRFFIINRRLATIDFEGSSFTIYT